MGVYLQCFCPCTTFFAAVFLVVKVLAPPFFTVVMVSLFFTLALFLFFVCVCRNYFLHVSENFVLLKFLANSFLSRIFIFSFSCNYKGEKMELWADFSKYRENISY